MSTATMRFDPRLRLQVEGSLGERLNPKSLPMAVILIIHSICVEMPPERSNWTYK